MTDGHKDLICMKPFKILFYLPLLEDILSVEILYILATFMSLDCIGKYDLNCVGKYSKFRPIPVSNVKLLLFHEDINREN